MALKSIALECSIELYPIYPLSAFEYCFLGRKEITEGGWPKFKIEIEIEIINQNYKP